MRTINDKKDLEQLLGYNSLGTRFTEGFNRFKNNLAENPKLYLKRTLAGLGLIAMLATGCKEAEAKPTYEEIKEPEAVVETYQEPEEEEVVVEEVKPTLEDKFKEYNLEGLMQEIEKNDPELYEHYTTGDVDALLPVLANISKYISNEKILERRPTAESLAKLDTIISPIDNEQHKQNYVENSFKKSYAIIVAGSSDFSILDSLLPMWLCDQLNIDYLVINNTNNQDEISENYFNWWKQNSGMWSKTKEYYDQIQDAIKNGSTDKIKVNLNASQILEEIAYQNETLDVDNFIIFVTAGGIVSEKYKKLCKTMDGSFSSYTAQQFMDSLKPNDRILEYTVVDNSCIDKFYNYVEEHEKIRRVSSPSISKADEDLYNALIIAFLNKDKRMEPKEIKNITKTEEQLEKEGITDWPINGTYVDTSNNITYSTYFIDGKVFYIANGGRQDLEVNIVGINKGQSALYKQSNSINNK